MKRCALLPIALLLAAGGYSQTNITAFKPTRVAVFKNGTYFLKKEAEASPVDGRFSFAPPDNVLFGTFWLSVGKNTGVKSISFKADSFSVQKPVTEMADVIVNNIGRTLTIRRAPYGNSPAARENTGLVLAYNRDTETLKMQLGDGKVLITRLDDLEEIIADAATARTFKADSIGLLGRVTLEKDVPRTSVVTLGLYDGIAWYPSYQFRVLNDKEARLDMKATIDNKGEALLQTPLDLVVGSPSMFFEKKLDPICQAFLGFYLDNAAISNNSYNIATIPMQSQQRATYNFSTSTGEEDEPDVDRNTEGEKTQDLYYYKLGIMDIEANSRLLAPVFSQTFSFRDIYEIDIPATSVSDYTKLAVYGDAAPLEVFHSFRFTNSGKSPITSGAILVLDEKENPLAQEEIKYTPVGAEGLIKLSKAIDVQARNEEEVAEVQDNFRKINKLSFSRAAMRGQIKLSNYQEKKIKLRISKRIKGEAGTISNGGKATRLKVDGAALNPVTNLEWDIELNPGEKLTLTYEYSVLIR